MSVLKEHMLVFRIATMSWVPTLATVVLVTPLMLMGVAVLILTSVHWKLTIAPRIA
jgi:hypothetical protein